MHVIFLWFLTKPSDPPLSCSISKPAILPSYWKLLSSTSYPGSLFLRFCAFLFLVSFSHLHGQYPPAVSSSFSQPAFANYRVLCTVPGIEATVETHLHGIVFWRAPGWTRTMLLSDICCRDDPCPQTLLSSETRREFGSSFLMSHFHLCR